MIPTRRLSDAHEADLARMLGGRVARGSGCTFRDQADGRQGWRSGSVVFAFDGKSTLGKSIGVSRAVWQKLVEQAHWARPLLALRYYRSERLQVDIDLAVLRLADLSELVEHSRCADAVRALMTVVHDGQVQYLDHQADPGVDRLVRDVLDLLDGRRATRGTGLPEGGLSGAET